MKPLYCATVTFCAAMALAAPATAQHTGTGYALPEPVLNEQRYILHHPDMSRMASSTTETAQPAAAHGRLRSSNDLGSELDAIQQRSARNPYSDDYTPASEQQPVPSTSSEMPQDVQTPAIPQPYTAGGYEEAPVMPPSIPLMPTY